MRGYHLHLDWWLLLYLAAVLDLHRRWVIGWVMSDKPDSKLAVNALDMAYLQRGCPSDVLFHNDQGSQS